MVTEYTGTIHWIYGEKKWHEKKGNYKIHGHKDEEIKFFAESDKEALKTVLGRAREKINNSKLPGRPIFGTIELFLKKLESAKREVSLENIKTDMSKPVFN
ncbi:hypothetical protein GOV13_00595 [Candidatus Pacearchaeota archaeon]|nr:hypothetical protein [Candidatus Pacearchaeota archaeon]